ncbi:hypothetical protein [Flavicella sp.]|uniref:toxin-antitoxin system YwqK family antitoxin n=1 Tax=Flavicella sp. TaxID=2957742 RepID=UPI003017701D
MKNIITITIIILSITKTIAQNDTLWFDNSWKKCNKKSAKFYRPIPEKIGDLYLVKDFYINGNLQMEVFSKYEKIFFREGKSSWYNENGSLCQQANYKNNTLNGLFISFYDNEKFELIYKNGKKFEGTEIYNNYNDVGKLVFKNYNKTKHTHYFITAKHQVQSVCYFDSITENKNYSVLEKYYDKTNKFLGQLTYADNQPKNGIKVVYNHQKGNNNISEILYYKNKKHTHTDTYYSDGTPREIFTSKPEAKSTFYDIKGNVLGELLYQNGEEYNGNQFQFYSTYNNKTPEGIIEQKRTFALGLVVKDEAFYTNGQLKIDRSYNAESRFVEKEISYAKNGEILGKLKYSNDYKPLNGIRLGSDIREWFREGKIVKTIHYYPESDTIFSKQEFDKVTYFNKDHSLLGVLKIDTTQSYFRPLNGKQFVYYNNNYISDIIEYLNGVIAKQIQFHKRYKSKEIFKKETFFKKEEHDIKTREINYYSNGNKQREITFHDDKDNVNRGISLWQDRSKGVFYDSHGFIIGNYNYLTQTGTEYEYFDYSDYIKSITTRENGKVNYEKVYQDYSTVYSENRYVLIKEIDILKEGKFYDKYENLIFSITYKNEKPYEGVSYNSENQDAFTYKKGVKEGAYKKFYFYDFPNKIMISGNYSANKREGIFTYTDRYNRITKTETYKNDVLDGKTIFYDSFGKLLSTVVYKNGLPHDGEFSTLINHYTNENKTDSYKNGVLMATTEYLNTGTIKTDYFLEYSQTIIFYPDTQFKKYSLQFKGINKALSGKLVRYNTQGIEMHSANLLNGDLISGEIWIIASIYDYKGLDIQYYRLVKNEKTYGITIYNTDKEIVFQASEKANLSESILKELRLDINSLRLNNLY